MPSERTNRHHERPPVDMPVPQFALDDAAGVVDLLEGLYLQGKEEASKGESSRYWTIALLDRFSQLTTGRGGEMTQIICRASICLFWEHGVCGSEEIEYEPDVGCLTFQDMGDMEEEGGRGVGLGGRSVASLMMMTMMIGRTTTEAGRTMKTMSSRRDSGTIQYRCRGDGLGVGLNGE